MDDAYARGAIAAFPHSSRASQGARRRESRRALTFVVLFSAFIVYTLCAVLLFRQAWMSPTTRSIGVGGDSRQFMWFLQWTAWALTHHHDPFITAAIDYPGGVNVLWNTSVIFPGLVLTPITLWLGPIVSYNVLVTLSLSLSAWCAMLAYRRLGGGAAGSALGGLLYGFSPYMIAQSLGHPHLTVAFVPPLVLLLSTIVGRRPLLGGIALGILGAVQLLTAEEVLATLFLVAIVGLVLAVLIYPGGPGRAVAAAGRDRLLIAGLSAACTFGILSFWPLAVQFAGPNRVDGVLHPTSFFSTDLLNLIAPTRTQWITPSFLKAIGEHFQGNLSEQDSYLGAPLLCMLLIVGLVERERRVVSWALLTAAVIVVLSLGPGLLLDGRRTDITLPWKVFEHVSLVGHILPGRFFVYVYLLVGLVVALTVDRFAHASGLARLAGLGAVALALLPLAPRPTYPAASVIVPPFFRSGGAVARIPAGSVAVVAPFSALSPFDQQVYTASMLWQAVAGLRFVMPEGYAFIPQGQQTSTTLAPPPSVLQNTMLQLQAGRQPDWSSQTMLSGMRQDLRAWRTKTVIVGPMAHRRRVVALFTQLLGRPPINTGGVAVWWNIATGSANMMREPLHRPRRRVEEKA